MDSLPAQDHITVAAARPKSRCAMKACDAGSMAKAGSMAGPMRRPVTPHATNPSASPTDNCDHEPLNVRGKTSRSGTPEPRPTGRRR